LSEGSGAQPPPLVLDVSVITAIVRGDAAVTGLVLDYDARSQPLVIPVLAMTAAALDTRTEEAEELLAGLERLDSVIVAPVRDAEQAARLAAVIAGTGLAPWDAHVAAVADAAICPILTLKVQKWRQHAGDLDKPLHIIEIADPEEG
jgi:predicted nucleic acid-binding protein